MKGRARRAGDFPAGGAPCLPGLSVLLALLPFVLAPPHGGAPALSSPAGGDAVEAVVLPEPVFESMNDRFLENNEHWDEAPVRKGSARFRMPGTGRHTPLEYMGCLQGEVEGDTLRIRGWTEARDLVQFQFGVDGSCDHVRDHVGTWHTHPFRIEVVGGDPVKERSLSPADLETFGEGGDLVIVAVWDVDSLDVAARAAGGGVEHPAPLLVE